MGAVWMQIRYQKIKGLGKAKRHFWGVFKSFKSIILGVTQPLGIFFHVVGSMIYRHVP